MKNFSFNLVKQREEFTLMIINATGSDIFIESKRAMKNRKRIVSAGIFKDRKDFLQEQLYKKIINGMAATIPSFSIPMGNATIEIHSNFDFDVKEFKINGQFVQIAIGKIEN